MLGGFRHLLAAEQDETILDPEVHELLAGRRLRLGELAFVMWEDRAKAPAMKIEARTEIFHRHGGALDMPPRPSGSPGALPGWLPFAGSLPQREVERAFLVLANLDPRPGAQLVDPAAAQLPVGRERL